VKRGLAATELFAHRQRGAALLILLTIVILAMGFTLLNRLNKTPPDILRASDNSAVLAEAKAALVGFALSSNIRPGMLPCPDASNPNDGTSDTNLDGTCVAYVGYLPWQTLGLADLRDTDGERLWYALHGNFDGTQIINSETQSGLFLDGTTTRYVAFVFAPGESLQGQSRPPSAQNNVGRYLEDDNANGDTNFVTTATSPFNDQLVAIGQTELLQAVERRVLGEIKKYLTDYYDKNFYYPYPAKLNDTKCDSTIGSFQGHIPRQIQANCASLAEWDPAKPIPNWFYDNGWNLLVWYALAPACTQVDPNCSAPLKGFINVLNTPAPANKNAILIAAGPKLLVTQNRPAVQLSDLLDNVANYDNNLAFDKRPIDAASNDQFLIVAP